jgi:hypothetical protein
MSNADLLLIINGRRTLCSGILSQWYQLKMPYGTLYLVDLAMTFFHLSLINSSHFKIFFTIWANGCKGTHEHW